MGEKGEITVFLAMILVSVCALLCGMAESVRTAGARCYLRMAVDSSMDSLMAQYHRELWKQYRILGLEYDSPQTLEWELGEFLTPYMNAQNWYPMKISCTEAKDIIALTEGEGRYLEQEILDYMKYGLLDTDWDELDESGADALFKTWKEGGSVSRVSGLYTAHSKEAVQLEKALEKIDDGLKSQSECWSRAGQALEWLDGSGFISQAERMCRELEKLPALVGVYEKKADQLAERLGESRKQFENERQELSSGVQAAFEDEIAQYESYVSHDGQRRREVVRLREYGPDRIQWIRGAISMAGDVMDYIDSWEPEDEDDELDEAALWRPVAAHWSGYAMLSLGIEFGVKDKEKEDFLEQVGRLVSGGILELVLPEGTVVSGRKLSLDTVPSASVMREDEAGREGLLIGAENLLQRLLVGEYDIRFFKGFQKEMQNQGFYELEYIVHGADGDRENLAGVISRLVALREGMNLIHIFSDPGKRQEARSLALAIVGGSGVLPLVSLTAFLIMSVWALGEALMDVRCLLDGGKVPVLKTREDWRLSLDELLSIGKNRGLGDMGSWDGKTGGLSYKGYMRILIFGSYKADLVYRMMDVMEINIGKKQSGFSMERCACNVEMKATVSGKHVFFSAGLWKSQMGDRGPGYETRIGVSDSYLNDPKSGKEAYDDALFSSSLLFSA